MRGNKRCPFCSEEILAVAKKCKHCGEWLDKEPAIVEKKMITCPACAEEIEEGLNVCPVCKEALVKRQEKEPIKEDKGEEAPSIKKDESEEKPPTKEKTAKKKPVVAIVGGIIGVIAVIFIIVWAMKSNESDQPYNDTQKVSSSNKMNDEQLRRDIVGSYSISETYDDEEGTIVTINGTIDFSTNGICETYGEMILSVFDEYGNKSTLKYNLQIQGKYEIKNSVIIYDYKLENISIKLIQSDNYELSNLMNEHYIPQMRHEIVIDNTEKIIVVADKYLKTEDENGDIITYIRLSNTDKTVSQQKHDIQSNEILPDGTYRFDIAFAEFGGQSMGEKVTVIIKGTTIKVIYEGDGELGANKGTILDEGTIMKHKSGVWIISTNPSDTQLEDYEIGGCGDGPSVIDFQNKKWKTC